MLGEHCSALFSRLTPLVIDYFFTQTLQNNQRVQQGTGIFLHKTALSCLTLPSFIQCEKYSESWKSNLSRGLDVTDIGRERRMAGVRWEGQPAHGIGLEVEL